MTETKTFSLRTVLTVTTGRLLTEPKGPDDNGIGDVYAILNWITGDSLYTHQLPRAMEAARPWLLQCFPELAPASASMASLDGWLESDQTGGQEGIKMWITEIRMMFPALRDSYDTAPMPEGWIHVDPLIEAQAMAGDPAKVIVLEAK